MKKTLMITLALFLGMQILHGQEDKMEKDKATQEDKTDQVKSKEKPCTSPKASQFDFWVGEWDLTWGDDATGTNIVEKTLGGCVIQENFDGNPGQPGYLGKSWTVYDPKKNEWKQTWVDNQGGYLDFTGKMEGSEMILSRTTVEGWTQTMYRMVFHNISEDSLDWRWEKSIDNGNNWEVKWAIHYERKK